MKLKTVLVDDEYPALQLLTQYCSQIDFIDFANSFTKPTQAFEYLTTNPIDLLLLDVQMPFLNGLDLLAKLPQKPLCIFISANPNYAVNAFELDVVDYLLKPIGFDRFKKAVEKVVEYISYKDAKNAAIKYIMVKADYKMTRINVEDISRIEGSGEYIKIFTQQKIILVRDSLNNFSTNILPDSFIRVHKSFIIPISQVEFFSTSSVTLKDGIQITIGRSFKKNVLDVLVKKC
ncbi:MAG: LytR/AlgR family response regulator transcription factor [Ferruginibacter sp.]